MRYKYEVTCHRRRCSNCLWVGFCCWLHVSKFDMPQLRSSKFVDNYKRKSGGIDKRALRGLRRSLDWKQSRSQVVGQRRKIMDASAAVAMSPVDESYATKSNSYQPSAKSGKHHTRQLIMLRFRDEWRWFRQWVNAESKIYGIRVANFFPALNAKPTQFYCQMDSKNAKI